MLHLQFLFRMYAGRYLNVKISIAVNQSCYSGITYSPAFIDVFDIELCSLPCALSYVGTVNQSNK